MRLAGSAGQKNKGMRAIMAANRNRGSQGGFTLIEVMIVTAIIGIISMVVLPEIRGYQARAKVSEAMLLLTQCRNTIQEVYLSGDDVPLAGEWGCEAERPSKYVERINTKPYGVVVITLSSEIGDGRLAIHDITLAPLNRTGALMGDSDLGSAIRRWRCGSPADGTDVLPNLLPSTCRG
jgi:type IV pilus assembly protein PilA